MNDVVSYIETFIGLMNRKGNLVVFIASDPRMLESFIDIVSFFIFLFGYLIHEILSEYMRNGRYFTVFKFDFELFHFHAWCVEGMVALIEHVKHDDGAGPNIN